MGNYDYLYLDAEDAAFARSMRLTEDKFLDMAGGLKKYTEFRLNRAKARAASLSDGAGGRQTFDVPRLPSTTEEAMSRIVVPGTKEEDYAQYLLSEQMTQVQGVMDLLYANRSMMDEAERRAQDRANMKEGDLLTLRKEAASVYGFAQDSQSAKDYAEQKYKERYSSKRGY